jgi:hypothetical protein
LIYAKIVTRLGDLTVTFVMVHATEKLSSPTLLFFFYIKTTPASSSSEMVSAPTGVGDPWHVGADLEPYL